MIISNSCKLMNDASQQKSVFVDEETQKRLNTPLSDNSGLGGEDNGFLQKVISLIEDGKIDLHKPSTLLNQEVYDGLRDEAKGHADMEAVNLLNSLRDIKGLHDSGNEKSFQMQNLVEQVRQTKERIEKEAGDIFII